MWPLLSATPSVPAGGYPHTGHLLSVVDNEGVVDGRLDPLRSKPGVVGLEEGQSTFFFKASSPVLNILPHALTLDP